MRVAAAPPFPASTLPEKLRDAASVAFIGLLLGIPLIGLTTVDAAGMLTVVTRWQALAVTVAALFAGRLVLRLAMEHGSALAAARPRQRDPAPLPVQGRPWTSLVGALALGAAAMAPLVWFDNRYAIDVMTTLLIYIMLGWGLNIVVGLAGLLDLGYVAFYAVGAYAYAILSTQFGFSFWLCLPIAALLAATFGVLLGYPTLRLRGDYLAIVTLGFGEIIRVVLLNWTELSNGPDGIASIPRPSFFGLPFSASDSAASFSSFFGWAFAPWHRSVFLYYLIFALAMFTNLIVLRLRRLPIGLAWEAMREDEIACKALGINVTNVKLSAFAIGASLAGLAGVFFAARQGFISPESFTFGESAIILAIVVLGGSGSQLGVVLAACVLVLLPELGRGFAQYRMVLFGAAMILIMVWRPRGLLARRVPTQRLAP